eukprot:2966628-Rhodomonas_salina.2
MMRPACQSLGPTSTGSRAPAAAARFRRWHCPTTPKIRPRPPLPRARSCRSRSGCSGPGAPPW